MWSQCLLLSLLTFLRYLITRAKGVDKESKKLKGQILDFKGPLGMAYEHISLWQESKDNAGSTFSTQDVDGRWIRLSKALTLLESC